MSDQTPEMTPEQAREVRRLLADARHTAPMPADVAARMDRVVADLATQAAPTHDGEARASVVDLAARRRRRLTKLLVAAAAVVAVGFGFDQLTHGVGSSSDSASTAGGSASQEDAGAPPKAHRSHGSHADRPQASSDGLNGSFSTAKPARIRPAHFAEDVTHLRDDMPRAAYDYAPQDRAAAASCTSADRGRGTVFPVRYDGNLAVLVFRPPRGDTQVVDLFGCGSEDVLRSVTLDAP